MAHRLHRFTQIFYDYILKGVPPALGPQASRPPHPQRKFNRKNAKSAKKEKIYHPLRWRARRSRSRFHVFFHSRNRVKIAFWFDFRRFLPDFPSNTGRYHKKNDKCWLKSPNFYKSWSILLNFGVFPLKSCTFC